VGFIGKGEACAERRPLAELSGERTEAVPGLWPLRGREDILPFREAARRYLVAATRLHERDPRGLAQALGVSYFALRRLLARYDVPFPAVRPRKRARPSGEVSDRSASRPRGTAP
jgi:hypothetical protein